MGSCIRACRVPVLVVLLFAAAACSGTGSGDPQADRPAVAAPDGPSGLPDRVESPSVDPDAPYTPVVRRLIDQLLPSDPPTLDELNNAALLFQGMDVRQFGGVGSCHTVGHVRAPTGTDPSIAPMCWADSVGIDVTSGPNQARTTAPPEPLALASSFDRYLNNAWGQAEGVEGRHLMVTGLYGPQVDVVVHPDWQRALDTFGEDPFLAAALAAEQVHGMQGQGLMAQVKHLAGFSGSDRLSLTEIQDQALHEIALAPFESTLVDARAASVMCAYNGLHDLSEHLPQPPPVVFASSPYGTDETTTWPIDEAHWSCQQPLTLNYILRQLWGSLAIVGSDYPATYSVSSALQGLHQEFPLGIFLSGLDPRRDMPPGIVSGDPSDPSGDTCAVGARAVPCDQPGAIHVSGIPGPGCPEPNGCGFVSAVHRGLISLPFFKQMLALVLYQQERFGLLGCDQTPRASTCTNPGGVAGDRSGNALLPERVRDTHREITQRAAEEGAVLLRNDDGALPLTEEDLDGGVAISGAGADHLIAAPQKESATGFPDRNAISPLDRLLELSDDPSAFTFTPAGSPTGTTVASAELSAGAGGNRTEGLARVEGPGAPTTDAELDFTAASDAGPLEPGSYRWTGNLHVEADDTYTYRLQIPSDSPPSSVSLRIDGAPVPLAFAESPYCGQYYARQVCVPADRTASGTTEEGLNNLASRPLDMTAGRHRVDISFHPFAPEPASFRFAVSKEQGDIDAAAAAAADASVAVVFANDNGVLPAGDQEHTDPSHTVGTLPRDEVRLIRAVAAANPRTVVVLNTGGPVVTRPWIDDPGVAAVLQMWNAGSEGGTATARLLLGLAAPSGRSPITWPREGTDTIWAYDQPEGLYPGDTAGTHPERLNGLDAPEAHCSRPPGATHPCTRTVMTQGIYSGYRFYDQMGLAPQFPFGYGLSYTEFDYSDLSTRWDGDRLVVGLTVANTGEHRGTAVPQVYVGPVTPEPPGAQQALRSLAGFERVTLDPGATRRIEVVVPARSFQYWNEEDQAWVTPSGRRAILAGEPDDASRLPLSADVEID